MCTKIVNVLNVCFNIVNNNISFVVISSEPHSLDANSVVINVAPNNQCECVKHFVTVQNKAVDGIKPLDAA